MKDFTPQVWIAWLGATIVAGVTMTFTIMAYSHSTFVTEKEINLILDRLNRIDNKLEQGLAWLHQNKK